MTEVVIMIGVSSSGKTTYCRKYFHGHEHISLDNIKNHDRSMEFNLIVQNLISGNDVVIDDTNLSRDVRSQHITLAKKYNAKITGVYLNTSIGLIEQRNWRRHPSLPKQAINKMISQLEIPHKEEGFDELRIIE